MNEFSADTRLICKFYDRDSTIFHHQDTHYLWRSILCVIEVSIVCTRQSEDSPRASSIHLLRSLLPNYIVLTSLEQFAFSVMAPVASSLRIIESSKRTIRTGKKKIPATDNTPTGFKKRCCKTKQNNKKKLLSHLYKYS